LPKVLDCKGYRFFFFSNEGDPLKPAHIHVRKDRQIAKFWLEPEVALANSWGFQSRELNVIRDIVEDNQVMFKKRWYDYFG
jgi:hypothetical protein